MPYHCARVRNNEVGRNDAEEGGREGLPKTGKNDEGFEEMVKERSYGLDSSRTENRLDCRTKKRAGEERREASQSSPTFASSRSLEDEDESNGEICSCFTCELNH